MVYPRRCPLVLPSYAFGGGYALFVGHLHMAASVSNPCLRKGAGSAFGFTAVFYLGGIYWMHSFSAGRFLEAFSAYAMAVTIAYVP